MNGGGYLEYGLFCFIYTDFLWFPSRHSVFPFCTFYFWLFFQCESKDGFIEGPWSIVWRCVINLTGLIRKIEAWKPWTGLQMTLYFSYLDFQLQVLRRVWPRPEWLHGGLKEAQLVWSEMKGEIWAGPVGWRRLRFLFSWNCNVNLRSMDCAGTPLWVTAHGWLTTKNPSHSYLNPPARTETFKSQLFKLRKAFS